MNVEDTLGILEDIEAAVEDGVLAEEGFEGVEEADLRGGIVVCGKCTFES